MLLDLEYTTHEDGKLKRIYPLSKCLESIEQRDKDLHKLIESLQAENTYLKEQYDKDEEISKLKARLHNLQERICHSFEITPDERAAIEAWKHEHSIEKHGGRPICASGAIGGEKYEFVATSIGDVGKYCCPFCEEKFVFREL